MRISMLKGVLLRALLAYVLAIALAVVAGPAYIHAQRPLSAWATEVLDSSYKVDSQSLAKVNGETALAVSLIAIKPFYIGENEIQPDFPVGCSFSVGNATLPLIVCLCILGAWPGLTIRQRLLMSLLSAMLLVPIIAVDIGLTTLGTVEYLLYHDLAPTYIPDATFMPWSSLLIGGGWLAEGVIVALIMLALWRRAVPILPATFQSDDL